MGGGRRLTAIFFYLDPKDKKPTLRSFRGWLELHPSKFIPTSSLLFLITTLALLTGILAPCIVVKLIPPAASIFLQQ